MKYLKIFGLSFVNSIATLFLFIIAGNTVHSITGDYIDRFNLSSVITVILCIGLFIGLTIVESKYLKLPLWTLLGASAVLVLLGCLSLAVYVAVIAGGIG